jgi:hypothetical protein
MQTTTQDLVAMAGTHEGINSLVKKFTSDTAVAPAFDYAFLDAASGDFVYPFGTQSGSEFKVFGFAFFNARNPEQFGFVPFNSPQFAQFAAKFPLFALFAFIGGFGGEGFDAGQKRGSFSGFKGFSFAAFACLALIVGAFALLRALSDTQDAAHAIVSDGHAPVHSHAAERPTLHGPTGGHGHSEVSHWQAHA